MVTGGMATCQLDRVDEVMPEMPIVGAFAIVPGNDRPPTIPFAVRSHRPAYGRSGLSRT